MSRKTSTDQTSGTDRPADRPTGTPVLVTTAHRGVFFGFLDGEPKREQITLTRARNCVYWTSDARGFLGLASAGPSRECRVGRSVPRTTLYDITSVTECTPEAVERWESGPWA